MRKVIWISWENHRRTSEICDYLSIRPTVILSSKKSLGRYYYLIKETLKTIYHQKPSALIVQNPSIVLATIAVLVRPFYKYKLVIDAHNEAVEPYTHNNFIVRFVARLLIRFANFTMVTNSFLAETVKKNSGHAIILPDRLPRVGEIAPVKLNDNSFNVILIATYAADEPIEEIINAASKLESKLTLYITGNYSKLNKEYIESLASNIIFTGFLNDEKYWAYLMASHAIIDLSLKDNCLVCGAYEGIAVEKPMILSNNKATVQYFNKGIVYTDNSVSGIERSFNSLIEHHSRYKGEIVKLSNDINSSWLKMVEYLMEVLGYNG